MEKILFINACPRKNSRTYELAKYLLENLGGEAEEINLYKEKPEPQTEKSLEIREQSVKSGDLSDASLKFAVQFKNADKIIIAAPYWDLLFPAILRTYLEAVTVCGLTFQYSEKGIPEGLCNAKKLYYITTAGGYIGENNYGFSYVKALSQNLLGIKEVSCFTAEGLDILGADVNEIMSEAKKKISEEK